MLAIGAGGMDVAVAMAGGPYYVHMPYIVGVRLVGELRPWATAKDVILELLRRFTVRGNVGKLLEFFGPGIQTLNAQQRVTITNMGTEIGVLTSLFPSDGVTREYFRRLGRLEDWREVLPDPDVEYDDVVEVDLSKIEPLVALPSNPDRVVPVREAAGIKVHQVMVGSCTNGSYTDLKAVAQILRGRRVHPEVTFFVHASSRADLELLAREGLLADLLAAGVNVSEPTCGACIGIGHVPAPGTRSVRAINRNFKGRSGLKDDEVYLTSPETAAATALTGVLTDPRDLGIPAPTPDLPESLPQDDPGLVPPLPEAEAARVKVERGPNIVPAPVKGPLAGDLRGRVLIKLGDDISTDHISPAGSEYLAYRSNIPKLAEFTFVRVDPEFSKRAREWGGGFIVGGENYGQGSSREHAAIAPMYLGVHGVIAKSFARIHHTNLINWGLVPMTFEDPADWERLEQGDELEILGIREAIERGDERLVVRNRTKRTEFAVRVNLNARERAYILAGGKLAHTKQYPIV